MASCEQLPLETRLQALGHSRRMSIFDVSAEEFFRATTQMTGNPYYMETYEYPISSYNRQNYSFPELAALFCLMEPEMNDLFFCILIEPFCTSEVKK